jgi:hypothetical protein
MLSQSYWVAPNSGGFFASGDGREIDRQSTEEIGAMNPVQCAYVPSLGMQKKPGKLAPLPSGQFGRCTVQIATQTSMYLRSAAYRCNDSAMSQK